MSSLPRASGITGMRTVPAALAMRYARANTNRRGASYDGTAVLARLSFHAVSSTSIAPGPGTRARKRIVPSTEVLGSRR